MGETLKISYPECNLINFCITFSEKSLYKTDEIKLPFINFIKCTAFLIIFSLTKDVFDYILAFSFNKQYNVSFPAIVDSDK